MREVLEEVRVALGELRGVKKYLLAFGLALAVLSVLTYLDHEELQKARLERERQMRRIENLSADYERQKVQLYELSNQLTEAEVDVKARLQNLEKRHE